MQCSPQELKEKLLRHLDNDYNVSYCSGCRVLQGFITNLIYRITLQHGPLSMFSYGPGVA